MLIIPRRPMFGVYLFLFLISIQCPVYGATIGSFTKSNHPKKAERKKIEKQVGEEVEKDIN